jgi:metal-dependent amidase/aminoacylase/carboxypeptidase family protein
LLQDIEGIEIDPPLQQLPPAIIVRIKVEHPLNTILLRTELDALNWKEESDLPFKSNNGLHHACGHDGHMASMITAIKIAARNKNKLRRNLVFCFQPGEEGKGGAKLLLAANPGLLNAIDECYALHFCNSGHPGTIYLGKGPVTAISAQLSITI